MSVGSKLEDRQRGSSVFRGFPLSQRAYGSRTSSVVVKYFHYRTQNFGLPTNLRENINAPVDVEVGTISSEVSNLTISKSIQQCSASFNLSLFPSKNWKNVLSPGDWIMIYIFNNLGDIEDTKNLVLVGNIDRVSRSLQRNEDEDKTLLRYQVSGRNFGKIFEDMDIWYDPYKDQEATLDVALLNAGLEMVGSPTSLVTEMVNIFLSTGGTTAQGKTTDLNAWRIPSDLANVFVEATENPLLAGDTAVLAPVRFADILETNITENLPGYKPREKLSIDSNGSLWDMIHRNSNMLLNECFVEEVRDADGSVTPTLTVMPRPIQTPFFEDLFGSEPASDPVLQKLNGAHKSLQTLATESFVEISQSEIIYEDLGKDDHSRMNLFWLRTPDAYEKNVSNVANLNSTNMISNPVFVKESIQRHGLKRFDQLLEFSRTQAPGYSGGPEIQLWKAFMSQLYDMHFANHLYDAGTIECSGVLEAELGKALVVKASKPEDKDKIYYIEGYEHKWTFPNGWNTVFTVTHGQFKVQDGSKNIFIDESEEDFGSPDSQIINTYVAQTETKR
jgi:hypothetical protein